MPMTEQTISLERLEETINVFGSFDENIRIIEHEMGVTVVSRDSMLKVAGEDPEGVMYAVKAIENLMTLASKGETINEQNVRYIVQLVREGKENQIVQLAGDVFCVTANGKPRVTTLFLMASTYFFCPKVLALIGLPLAVTQMTSPASWII